VYKMSNILSLQLINDASFGVDRDSSVGVATRYGPDDQGIEFRWERDFPHRSRRALGPIQPPIKWARVLFPRGKAVGARR
jgi:hypothetical protein